MLKVLRERSIGFNILSAHRVNKAQHLGMQTLPLQPERRFSGAGIDFVPQKRMADAGHMHTDLVRPSGLQPAFDIGILLESLQYFDVGNGILSGSGWNNCHPLAVAAVSSDISTNGHFVLWQNAIADRYVAANNGVVLELLCNALMGQIIFANQKGAGGIPINPVHNSGAQNPINAG